MNLSFVKQVSREDIGAGDDFYIENNLLYVKVKSENIGFCDDGRSFGYTDDCGNVYRETYCAVEIPRVVFERDALVKEKSKLIRDFLTLIDKSDVDTIPQACVKRNSIGGFSVYQCDKEIYMSFHSSADSTFYKYKVNRVGESSDIVAAFDDFYARVQVLHEKISSIERISLDEFARNVREQFARDSKANVVATSNKVKTRETTCKTTQTTNTKAKKPNIERALTGTAKQKKWASDIRNAFLRTATQVEKDFLNDFDKCTSAAWWIDNRNQLRAIISEEIRLRAQRKAAIERKMQIDAMIAEAMKSPAEPDGSRLLPDGTRVWLNERGQKHRDPAIGPALIFPDGNKMYFVNDVLTIVRN
jgi:hypothetical protein